MTDRELQFVVAGSAVVLVAIVVITWLQALL